LLEPWAGSARLGANVDVGYFAQDTSELNLQQSPLDFLVWECDMLPAEARDLLGRFLITGDDVFRPIKTLSGGEKNKLSLARLTRLNPNLLVLDEPTNHLDMDSREALAQVLSSYRGTLILVSHDRWLLRRITNHTLDLRDGKAHLFPGSYGEYRRRSQAKSQGPPDPGLAPVAPTDGGDEALSQREISKEIGRIEKLIEQMEKDIALDEESLRTLEERLANLSPHDDVLALTREHERLRETIDGEFAAWTEQCERLERLRTMQG
jgi:ATP-binding cassette, subfamily F, member 3